MSTSNTFTLTFALAFIVSALADPSCVRLGNQVCGNGLPPQCVHSTFDYSTAFDVDNGMVDFRAPANAPVALELYSGARMSTPDGDCCPANTFLSELACTTVQAQGSCCYDTTHVHVFDLPEHISCVHDVVNYDSFVPSGGAYSIPMTNASLNYEVELYGGQYLNSCCGCYLHSVSCGPC
jgi:hypothetical protein